MNKTTAVYLALAITLAASASSLAAQLPQDHEDQRVLREYMATLTATDFTHGVDGFVGDAPPPEDFEALLRNHIYSLMLQPFIGHGRSANPMVNAPPEAFLLSSIERNDKIYMPPVWSETIMSFVQWDYSDNPFRDNRALKMRAFMGAAVHLIMFDDYAMKNRDEATGLPALRLDWHGYQPVYFAAAYPGFKPLLPQHVQDAFETGLKRVARMLLTLPLRNEEPDKDLIAPVGLLYIVRAVNDPELETAIKDHIRPLFTDPLRIHPAGYWIDRGGLDTGFAGMANWFAVWAALMTDWDFITEAVERVYRLRSHLILPEPEGDPSGPSHFNTKLGGAASIDQWSWDTRDWAAAMVTDEAIHLTPLPDEETLRNAFAARARVFNSQLRQNINVGGRYLPTEELTVENTTGPWSLRMWLSWGFPASVNPGYEFYRAGTYAKLQRLQQENAPMLRSPFLRGETFVRNFGDAFVVARQPGYAAILHTGPVGSQHPDDGMHQFPGPLGFGGGQLSAFWTPAAGAVLLGHRRGMSYEEWFDAFEGWRAWPIHAVSGVTGDGIVFTSARIVTPDTKIDINGARTTVEVTGVLPSELTGQDGQIRGTMTHRRTFTVTTDRLRVETTFAADGRDTIAELYETLPVHRLTDARQNFQPTAIEFEIDGQWETAGADFRRVTAVRLTRFEGAAEIRFDQPQRAKLSDADWKGQHLGMPLCRNVLIDLLQTDGQPAKVDGEKSVSYTIRGL